MLLNLVGHSEIRLEVIVIKTSSTMTVHDGLLIIVIDLTVGCSGLCYKMHLFHKLMSESLISVLSTIYEVPIVHAIVLISCSFPRLLPFHPHLLFIS